MRSTDRTGPRRRWRIAALAALIAAAALLAALPQLLSRTVARRILTARAGQILRPARWMRRPSASRGSVRPRSTAWSSATIAGIRLIAADRAVFELEPLADPLPAAEDRIADAARAPRSTIERRDDGRIDLYETIKPIIREHPEHRLLIEIEGGRLRFRDPALAEPIVADRADIRLDIPRDPRPVEWNVVLGHDAGDGKEPARAVFKGSVHRPG